MVSEDSCIEIKGFERDYWGGALGAPQAHLETLGNVYMRSSFWHTVPAKAMVLKGTLGALGSIAEYLHRAKSSLWETLAAKSMVSNRWGLLEGRKRDLGT